MKQPKDFICLKDLKDAIFSQRNKEKNGPTEGHKIQQSSIYYVGLWVDSMIIPLSDDHRRDDHTIVLLSHHIILKIVGF